MANSIGTASPSAKPFAAATEALPVAMAFAPAFATAMALPASQMLKSTSGSPRTCSFANCSNLLAMRARLGMCAPPRNRWLSVRCCSIRRRMASLTNNAPALLEALTEAALIAGGRRVIVSNAAARRLLGGAIEGAPLDQVISHPAAMEALERSGADAAEDVELTGLGGSRRHWLMRSAPLTDGTLLIRFVDRSEARAAEQMRVDFVANASHELRTPLSTLIGYAETLREQADDIDPATRERFLSVVHDEARRMQRVVEDLISLSRIEAEKFSTPTEAVAVGPLIDQALEGARRMAGERGSVLTREIASGLPPIVADR